MFFHQSPKSVLISCKDGTVLHVEAPASGKYDTSKTFHLPLTNLKTREYHFKSVKDKLRVSCYEILLFCFVFPLQLKCSLGGEQGRRSPPTNVALVRFRPDGICGLSLLLVLSRLAPRAFLRVLRFSSPHKSQQSKFQFG